jgi:NAD(P)-dependent dehydrogenase (short-subunit alcohol dehydrogenase family)
MLTRHRILITGSSEGLGLAIAEACLKQGARVVLCARTEPRLQAAHQDLATRFGPSAVAALPVDVSREEERERLIAFAQEAFGGLDGLVNNAGISGPKGALDEIDFSSWIETLQTNLIASVDLCRRVLPLFRTQGKGGIVNISGGGATSPMPRFNAYAVSKAALVRFTENLAEELAGTGIRVNAVAPGMLATRLLREAVAEGPEKLGARIHQQMAKAVEQGGSPPEKAAALCAFLLSDASEGINGRLISAIWDDWPTLPEHLDELRTSDIYTLRRILPKDRGKTWGDL